MADTDRSNLEALVALYASGRLNEAEARAKELIDEAPETPILHNILGAILAGRGDSDAAARAYRNAIEIDPEYAEAHNNLGNLLKDTDDTEGAIACFRRAIEINPDFAEAHSNLAGALMEAGSMEEAAEGFQRAVELDSRYFEDFNNLGIALQELGDFDGAIKNFARAIEVKPDFAEAYYNLGKVHEAAGRPKEAVAVYEKALVHRPGYPEAQNQLGNALKACDRMEEAMAAYRAAIAVEPGHVKAHENLGHALLETGRLEEAAKVYREALALRPESGELHRHLANAIRFTAPGDEITAMTNLYERPGYPPEERMHLAFALGKAYGDLKDYEQSFFYLADANRLKRASFDFDLAEVERVFSQIRETLSPEFFEGLNASTHDSERPIFIIGMPRSGTTLIEQILASHPDVYAAGELEDFDRSLSYVLQEKEVGFPAGLDKLDFSDLDRVVAAYMERLEHRAGDARRVTDKLPHNFLYAGLIGFLMPSARIIHVRRDAMDTCFSIFANLFTAHHGYAYDLAELGSYYRLYEALMDHWREIAPDRMFELDYESLVAEPEQTVRALLDYCGLEFDPACLEFHKTDRAVRTASAAQVRRPLYRDALQRWRHYEAHLQPLQEALSG